MAALTPNLPIAGAIRADRLAPIPAVRGAMAGPPESTEAVRARSEIGLVTRGTISVSAE